jgi:transposase
MLHTNNPIIKHKAGLLNLAEELGNVSKACKIMGVSRDTFYRYQELAEEGGIDALVNQNRRVPNLKNRADEVTERAVVEYAVEFPAHGQHRTSNELRKKGVVISGSGVRSIWQRHDLENFRKRLKALEEKVAREGIVLTDAQIAALEKKAHDDEASGEIETAHPGYLGSQDTFYVGNLKVLAVSTSRRSWIRTRKWHTASCIRVKRRSPPPTCSTIVYCRSTRLRVCQC